jgi:tripartite-type tricarboxylate transporter receptor subunit TctC
MSMTHETSPVAGRRSALRWAGALAAAMASPLLRAQPQYPTRPVRLIVPFPPGTSPDVIARLWSERFARLSGQPVVVDNRPGAGTLIAAQAAAAAAPDGHTLFWTVNNTFSINPFIYRKLPYSADDFVPITRILSVPFVLLVAATSPFGTLDDLVSAAKAEPGKLTYASAGIGTSLHVVMAYLLNQAGIQLTHVPYKDNYITDLTAGRIDVALDASTTAIAQLKGGKLRALGVTSAQRVEGLKDIAPIAERYPGFVGESWHGVFAPKGTPEAIVEAVMAHSQQIVQAPDFRAALTGYGLVPDGSAPAAFRRFLAEDAKAWARVVQDNRITVD